MSLPLGAVHHARLASGLILLAYTAMHLMNHMLGIASLDLAEAGLHWSILLWQSLPGTMLLYGAFAVHLVLALHTIHDRRHWRLPASEWFRLWAGFSLPLLLIGHVVGTRVATSFYGFTPDYEKVVSALISSGARGTQVALLAPGWFHGCMGLWIGLRHHPRMRRAKPVLVTLMIAAPVLSAIGFVSMSWGIEEHTDVVLRHALAARPHADDLVVWRQALLLIYLVLIIGAFVSGRVRHAEAES